MQNFYNSSNNKGGGATAGKSQNSPKPNLNFKLELFDGKQVRLDLFDKQAENAAKEIIGEGQNKINQIRIFYHQFIVFNEKINNSQDNFVRQLPYIKMIKSRARYSRGRKNIGVYFEDFLIKCVDKVSTLEDFKLICSFFESVVAFTTYFDKEKNHAFNN
jgi:CRISPR-associated protein Csm2